MGLSLATVFFCFSITPSLMPRSSFVQGFVSGASVAIGYGIGVLLSALIRWFTEKDFPAAYKPHAWKSLAVVAPIAILIFLILGAQWQDEVRTLVGWQKGGSLQAIRVMLFTILFGLAFIALGRAVQTFYKWLQKKIDAKLPRRLSVGISLVLVVLVSFWVASGLFANGFMAVMNRYYGNRDTSVPEGYDQPASMYKSGSPTSLSTWDTLGYQGRKFVAGGPSQEAIADFTDSAAKEPIRAYVGMRAAETAEQRAEIAVQELKRTGAFDRKVLVLASTTGSGWLEPISVDAIEYMYGGDTAIVSQQYSYLPSWISYLVDQSAATQTSQALYDAVYSAWSALPKNDRPKLISFGLSLGSFGAQTPYSGINDIRLSVDGALFQGTPNFTRLWRNTTDNRDDGSPEWLPTYKNGVTARFAATSEDIQKDPESWKFPRVLYMQHASDPVVWFDFSLALHKPDWLREDRGTDVSPNVRWYPFVTFVQVVVDQIFAMEVPN